MIYVKRLFLPGEEAEYRVIQCEKRTCFTTFYPFKIFPQKDLNKIEFSPVTMLYGGNGSGKSTLLNVLAHKVRAVRYSDFNDAPLFDCYVDMCDVEYARVPRASYVLTSDDVFDYVLGARTVNETIDEKRNQLFERYAAIKRGAADDPSVGWLKGLDDYERWSETREILSPKRSQSSYVKKRVVRDVDLFSNGETAMNYFVNRIEDDALYFLDEPENSLSVERQLELAEYIEATARVTKSQFIIATHSPILLSMKEATVYNLDDCPASVCDWTELPNVRRYFDFFMERRDEFL